MDLSYNQLTGEVPRELGGLTSLRSLGLHHNRLSGVIPWELSEIDTLQRLIVNNNDLTGTVPHEFNQMRALSHLHLKDNRLEGGYPVVPGEDELIVSEIKHRDPISGIDALNETTYVIED